MIARRFFLLAFAATALLLSSAPAAHAQQEQEAKAFVAKLANDAINVMITKGLTDEERRQRFRAIFTSGVDMPEIARFVLGRNWRTASEEQRAKFTALFEEVVVLTWANRFKDYAASVSHEVVSVASDGERGMMVESVVRRDRQAPIALMWRLRQGDSLRVIDLMVEGTSMAITYRSEYGAVIQSNGGKLDGLLVAMEKKIAELRQSR